MTDKETIKEVAAASREVAKATSKALDQTSSIGQFLYKVLGEPIEIAAGTFATDPLREYRIRRTDELKKRTEKILLDRNSSETKSLPPKTALELLEKASLEDEDELSNLWARLLADGLMKETERLEKRYVTTLSEFNCESCRLLTYLWKTRHISRLIMASGHIRDNPLPDSYPKKYYRKEFKIARFGDHEVEHFFNLGLLQYSTKEEKIPPAIDYDNHKLLQSDGRLEMISKDTYEITSYCRKLCEKILEPFIEENTERE